MSVTENDLAQLVRRVAARDPAAFRALYVATSAKLYGVILRILKRRDLSDEVLQEVYVRIWRRAGEFDGARASPITWMVAIARNRAIDEIRRRQIVETAGPIEDAGDIRDPAALALDGLEQQEDARRLADCLAGLATDRREMVRLAYLEGWSREALSQRFEAPVATVKTWLHRSLRQLKDCLER